MDRVWWSSSEWEGLVSCKCLALSVGFTENVATNTFCMFPSSRIMDSCATVDPLYIYSGEKRGVGNDFRKGQLRQILRWDPDDQTKVCDQSYDRYNLQLVPGTG